MNPVVTFGGPRYVSSRVGNLLEWGYYRSVAHQGVSYTCVVLETVS